MLGDGERRARVLLFNGLVVIVLAVLSSETQSASQDDLAYREGETLLGNGILVVFRVNRVSSGVSQEDNGGRMIPSCAPHDGETLAALGERDPVFRSACTTRRFRLGGDMKSIMEEDD